MKSKIRVFKFGGASLRDADNIRNVGNILKKEKDSQLIIVVSAMGKVTNALEKVVEAHANQNGEAVTLMEAVKRQHFEIAQQLFENHQHPVFTDLNDAFVEADWILEEAPHENFDYQYDQLVSIGEMASSILVSAYLNQLELPTHWLDARDIIRTDNLYREAWVQWEDTTRNAEQVLKPLMEKEGFIITQGFIGSSSENFTTTLGREGSDYTAAIFSYLTDAEDMTIWKDVAGVLTADPRVFDNVVKLDRLSYKEAIEMTYYGAKVIHPKTIKPLQNKNIPLWVKSFVDPAGSGTYISSDVEDHYPPMVAIENEQALLHISTRDFSFVAEHHLRYLFNQIADHRLQVNMMQNTAISFNVCVNDIDDRVDKFAASIEEQFKVSIERELELITVRHYQSDMLKMLRQNKIALLEERMPQTLQMVLKPVPAMRWKESAGRE